MSAAATSACWAASPPCLSGRVVMSPTAQTRSSPRTRPYVSTTAKPSGSSGNPGRCGPWKRGSAITRSASSGPSSSSHNFPSAYSCANVPCPQCSRPRRPAVARPRRWRQRQRVKRSALRGITSSSCRSKTQPPPMLHHHESQLVQRQRPRDARGRDESESVPAAKSQRLNRFLDGENVTRSSKSRRARERRLRASPERQQQRVVRRTGGPSRVSSSRASGRTASSTSGIHLTCAIARDVLPLVSRGRIAPEGLCDGQRAIAQMARSRENADANAVSSE